MKEIRQPVAAMKKDKSGAGARKEPTRPMKVKALISGEVPRLKMDPRGWGRELPKGILVILSADPGAGKSTFLLSTLSSVQGSVLYVCSEESVYQVAERARRIGGNEDMALVHTRSMFQGLAWAREHRPDVLVIDSLNASTAVESNGENASLVDKLQATAELCVQSGMTAIVISHVNADGEIYGPTTLEHASDINMWIRVSPDETREIGSSKNRFHRTGPYGSFKLVESGIQWLGEPVESNAHCLTIGLAH